MKKETLIKGNELIKKIEYCKELLYCIKDNYINDTFIEYLGEVFDDDFNKEICITIQNRINLEIERLDSEIEKL